MSFWDDLANSITGQTKNETAQQALTIQQQIAQTALLNEQKANELKYSPAALKQKTIQIIVISVVVLIGIILYFKYK